MKKIGFFLFFIILHVQLIAQQQVDQHSIYKIDKKADSYWAAATTTLLLIDGYLFTQASDLSTEQLEALNPLNIPAFDRFATENWNPNDDTFSNYTHNISIAYPLLLFIYEPTRKDAKTIGWMAYEAIGTTAALNLLSKATILRPRPFVFNEDLNAGTRRSKWAQFSFFSGHTSNNAVMCFFGAQVFADYMENPFAEGLIWAGAITLPALTGYFRVSSGQHYPSDVITGYAIGAGIGLLVPYLHRIKNKSNVDLGFTGTGLGLKLKLN